jgi:hypothetical protein
MHVQRNVVAHLDLYSSTVARLLSVSETEKIRTHHNVTFGVRCPSCEALFATLQTQLKIQWWRIIEVISRIQKKNFVKFNISIINQIFISMCANSTCSLSALFGVRLWLSKSLVPRWGRRGVTTRFNEDKIRSRLVFN